MEIKQLSPRLAGEWFGIPNTTVSLHAAKKYAKFGTVDLLSVQCLVKEGRKALYNLVSCFFSRLWSFNMDTYRYLCINLTVLSRIYFVHIYILYCFFKTFHVC